jgi:hypothetical protein
MKKTILICLLSIVNFIAYSQCTPDPSFTSPGIYPDSATNFSAACVGIDYSQTITNIVPLDTVIVDFGMGITTSIDSIVIDNVTGLPPGMSIACNPAGCAFIGGSTGCAIITGICNTIGVYPLVFNLSAYVGGTTAANPIVLDYYSITVSTDGCTEGIEKTEISAFKISPNPTSTSILIEGLKDVKEIHLMNPEGKMIQSVAVNELNSISLDLESINSGLYFIQLISENGTEIVKIIKE